MPYSVTHATSTSVMAIPDQTEQAPEPSPESVRRDIADWASWPDEQLLDLRLCDLDLKIAGSHLEDRIAQLYRELGDRGLLFRPHFWLSDEWFCPDDVPGIAIPFYLAHPRLAKLELNQMLEVEGGDPESCLRILRHEAGHAIENAFRLRRRRQRQQLFGKSSEPYPDDYSPKPYSKSFVLHLDSWYAQSHPDEDFAETFAVWLTPNAAWPSRYAGWPALKKLHYVDQLMQTLAGQPPLNASTEEIDPLKRLRKTLRQHYKKKRRHYGVDHPHFNVQDLQCFFSDQPEHAGNMTAVRFLSKIRKPVRRLVAGWTGVYQYTIDQLFGDVMIHCRRHNLRLAGPEEQAKQEFTVFLTVQAMNYVHTGGRRVAL
jgi:hypothetical protein